jgi:hypothetical protein
MVEGVSLWPEDYAASNGYFQGGSSVLALSRNALERYGGLCVASCHLLQPRFPSFRAFNVGSAVSADSANTLAAF